MPTYLNMDVASSLLGPGAHAVDYWSDNFQKQFLCQHGWVFALTIYHDGTITFNRTPVTHDHESMVVVFYMKAGSELHKNDRSTDRMAMKLNVPTRLLFVKKPLPYTLYWLRMEMHPECSIFDADARSVFQKGYFGITKRHPFERFREHHRDAMLGRGHLLHKTWHAIDKSGAKYLPNFYIANQARSQDEIYALEEQYVDNLTLAPKGLNAIPGGYAGIKFLHKLSILKRGVTDVASRNAALIELERSKISTHYRSGHIRRLGSGKSTWVNPCWVNAGAVS